MYGTHVSCCNNNQGICNNKTEDAKEGTCEKEDKIN